jgi:hypothetical protein
VGSLLNLRPLLAAQKMVDDLFECSGMAYFTRENESGQVRRLDQEVLDRIVDLACNKSAQDAGWLPVQEHDIQFCHRIVRRQLIHQLTVGMIESGY